MPSRHRLDTDLKCWTLYMLTGLMFLERSGTQTYITLMCFAVIERTMEMTQKFVNVKTSTKYLWHMYRISANFLILRKNVM